MTDSVARLYDAVVAARSADPAKSRTARLLRAGRAKMAKKLAEEAVEVVIDAMAGQPEAVWAEMRRRELMFGIAEKVPKDMVHGAARRRVVSIDVGRVRKRR